MNFLQNKTIIVMGGGTAGWIAALKFLYESKKNNLNLKVNLIASEEIGSIGVGEGSTPLFADFISDVCHTSLEQFLYETKGAVKYGIRFNNWNFDDEYYYHLFTSHSNYDNPDHEIIYNFCQYAINNNLKISQKNLQKKIHGASFDLVENNLVNFNINSRLAYHFDAKLVVEYFKKIASLYSEFTYVDDKILEIKYADDKIDSLILENSGLKTADFFINCLGFHYNHNQHDIVNLDIIPNNKAITLQVKNNKSDSLEPYTTSTAQEYGWAWKIPQYEKTGYGYVYSDHFVKNEDRLLDDLIKTFDINENDILRQNKVSFKSFYNKKQLKSNSLDLGLSSGFLEPLEATSINLTLTSLNLFFDTISNNGNIQEFNLKMNKIWEGVKNFIIMHYFNNSSRNDYWKYFNSLNSNYDYNQVSFAYTLNSYYSITLGLKMKDISYAKEQEAFLRHHLETFFAVDQSLKCDIFMTQREILDVINEKINS